TFTPNTPATPAGQPAAPVPNPAMAAAANLIGESNYTFSSLLTVLSDDRSNAIVVSGTVDDIRLIKDLVDKVDVLLAQVRIEVVIVQVSLNDDEASGIQSLGLQVSGSKLVGFSSTIGAGASGNGVNGIAITNGTVTTTVNGGKDLAYNLNIGFGRLKGKSTILQTPNVVTTHNKKAEIIVGQQIPTIGSFTQNGTSTATTTGSTLGLSTNVSQQQVGTDLVITPLIGNDGSVQLDISQTVSSADFANSPININGTPQPIINTNKTTSFVTAKSGEILVLSGFQNKQVGYSDNRLAILGQIPVLGWLFGNREKTDKRTELLFFLRPTILTNTGADNTEAMEEVSKMEEKASILKSLGRPPEPPPVKNEDESKPALNTPHRR
ncbi:MAG TPA: hypothetical protein VKC60_00945, partial [Opitutaceae bacterium]|nr:hypothetical protein [Opitutaceae bacterium]